MTETSSGGTYSKEKSRRGYESLEAVDPHDGGLWQVLLPHSKMEWVTAQGHGATLELIDTVRWSLRNIRHLYRGIRDDEHDVDDDGWLCYVATPPHAYDWKRGAKIAGGWEDEVFLVYVTDERVVYLWYWDKCDPADPHKPRDHELRFQTRVF